MFGSDSFPLGPNGKFPRKRIRSFDRKLIPGVSTQDTYLSGGSSVSKLPNLERDFHSSNAKAKARLMSGAIIRRGGYPGINRFRPRYAPFFGSRKWGLSGYEDFEAMMDADPVYDSNMALMDEGETDDSVGYYRGFRTAARFLPFGGLIKAGVRRR